MATGIQLTPPPRRQNPMAQALMGQAMDASPKGHPLAALAQALQGYLGGKMVADDREAFEAEQAAMSAQEQAIADALMGQFAAGEAGVASLGGMNAPVPGQPQLPPAAAALMQAGAVGPANQLMADALMGREAPDPFTLSPGQTRYGPDGSVVASLPASRRDNFQRVSAFVSGEQTPSTLLFDPDSGSFERTHPDGRREVIPSALVQQVSVQGGIGDVMPSATGAGTEKEQQELRDAQRRSEATLSTLSQLRTAVRDNPGATGIRGATGEFVGGVAGSLAGERAGGALTQAISGTSPEALARTRSLAQKVMGDMIPAVLNDDSGRYSDKDMERVRETLRVLKLEASPQQIDSAIEVLTEIELAANMRRNRDLSVPFQYDLATDEGVNAWGAELVNKYGFDEARALEILLEHRRLLGVR